ncbi:MAG: acyl-CoA thioesterase [Flavobacteriales bacterium]|nr:acyl-CoA thioesterase [Flavobacteriales bacterium]
MLTHQIQLRVRYAETDRMGYAYYGNYATYFEVARVEMLRAVGITYRSLEDEGILLPVAEYNIRFLLPAYYDDQLEITTTISEMPAARITFEYETHRGDHLLNRAQTTLVFVDKVTGKPMRCPDQVRLALQPHFR